MFPAPAPALGNTHPVTVAALVFPAPGPDLGNTRPVTVAVLVFPAPGPDLGNTRPVKIAALVSPAPPPPWQHPARSRQAASGHKTKKSRLAVSKAAKPAN